MDENILEIVEILEMLIDDLPSKSKVKLEEVVLELKKLSDDYDTNELMKIQDDLEIISNMNNIDSYSRNEIMNVLSIIETLI